MQQSNQKKEEGSQAVPSSTRSEDAVKRGESATKAAEQTGPKGPERQKEENDKDARHWREEG